MTMAWWILFAALMVASVAYVVTWFQLRQVYRKFAPAGDAVLQYTDNGPAVSPLEYG